MRATEIIRGVLDLIDQVECAQEEPRQPDPIGGAFAQLFAELSADRDTSQHTGVYDNSPNVHIQGIESVTTAVGHGTLGASSPADIRASTIAMYPKKG
jgi:hypothetical protein